MSQPLFGINFDDKDLQYFDQAGIEAWKFDAGQQVVGVITVSAFPPAFSYTRRQQWETIGLLSMEFAVSGIVPIDISPLVPNKFLKSQTMLDLLSSLNIEIGLWISDIDDLKYLKDPYIVGDDYIQYLAELIGLKFVDTDNATLEEKRRQLLEAISWYKIKGTYASFDFIASLSGLTINIKDLYATGAITSGELSLVFNNTTHRITRATGSFITDGFTNGCTINVASGVNAGFYTVNTVSTLYLTLVATEVLTDITETTIVTTGTYTNFTEAAWFMAKYEEELPPGIPAGYFKTPHLVFEIVLDRYYPDTIDYLWRDEMFIKTGQLIERSRPINAVAETRCLINVPTVEGGIVTTDPYSHVASIVTATWNIERKYFDSTPHFHFDTGYPSTSINFDQATQTFLSSVIRFYVGTGHKGVPPHSSFTLQTPVAFTGTVDPYTIDETGAVVFTMTMPATPGIAFSGLSELVLVSTVGSAVVVGATFPDTDKTDGVALKFRVRVTP